MSTVNYNTAKLSNGVDLFYLESGDSSKPTLLLLHGFPTSSRQFQKLIPLLSPHFHILAPDLPGYGQTRLHPGAKYEYTFENLGNTVELFLKEKKVGKFSIYIFDYGAPTGLRVALKQPQNVTAIISQNGNAYEEGLGKDFWAPLQILWDLEDKRIANGGKLLDSDSKKFKDIVDEAGSEVLGLAGFQSQYALGEPDLSRVNPEFALVDHLTAATFKDDVSTQLAYFLDYRKNLTFYPAFQKFFRETNVPILAVWGKNDVIFVEEGADAYKRDSKDVKVVKIEGGHFISLSRAKEVAEEIIDFFRERKIIG